MQDGTQGRAEGIAIVTGAASGMGEAAARLMHEAGWPLLLLDLNAQRLELVAGRLAGEVETISGDLSDPGFYGQLTSALAGRPVGALIHCAGLSPTMADGARVLEVNLAATIRLVDWARPRMAEGAAAVLFASMAGYMAGTQLDSEISKATTPEAVASLTALKPDSGTAYSVSKRGVQLLVQREAPAFGERGARIASISPGIIDTPMGRQEKQASPLMGDMVRMSALGREARAEEVAAVAVFLCSPAASVITGTDILVDGGATGPTLARIAEQQTLQPA